jgi:hypothetical protein
MSDQDFEGQDDLWTAIKKFATSGHSGPNDGRIFDGCLFVTEKEWAAIAVEAAPLAWSDMTAAERLSRIPIRILPNGGSEQLSDGRVLVAFADTLYLLPEFKVPPLPRLHLDGVYVT